MLPKYYYLKNQKLFGRNDIPKIRKRIFEVKFLLNIIAEIFNFISDVFSIHEPWVILC